MSNVESYSKIDQLRGVILTTFLKFFGCQIGKNLICTHWPLFRRLPIKNLSIGNNTKIGKEIHLEPLPNGRISIGNDCILEENIIISSGAEIIIGDNVSLGKNLTIRDDNHNIKLGEPIYTQGSNYKPVHINEGVIVENNCCILQGSNIPAGAKIKRNSVVSIKSNLREHNSYQGIPV